MTTRRRLAAFALVTVLGVTGAACGSDDDSDPPDTSLLEQGDQQGSGGDGSVPQDPPGNQPGGSDTGDEPTGSAGEGQE